MSKQQEAWQSVAAKVRAKIYRRALTELDSMELDKLGGFIEAMRGAMDLEQEAMRFDALGVECWDDDE